MQRPVKFGFLAVGLMLTTGCGVPVHEVARAVSPDRSKVALVYQEESRGLIETYTFVYIKPSGRKLNNHNDLVFRGGDMNGRAFGPVNVEWARTKNLIVGYCSGRTEVFVNDWGNWQANPQDQVAAHLFEELQGSWPATIPPDRRSGSPPCT